MELPDDVLQLIREFSRPWFKHHVMYKRILVKMSLYSFPELKNCLQYHPEQITPTLVKFEKAHTEYLLALDEYLCEDDWTYSKRAKYHEKGYILSDSEKEVIRLSCIGSRV
jgi:hypothetical protein